MPLPDLQVLNNKRRELGTPQPAAYEHGNHCEITNTAQIVTIRFLQQEPSLILGQPVPGAGSKLLYAFDPANSRSEFRAEQAGIGSFIRESPDCRKALIDSSSCQAQRFQVEAKSQDNGPV
jgi:hypothetical protein